MQKRISNLDGLRFISAWIVIICHFEVFKSYFGLTSYDGKFYSNAGQISVTFFFELSGFLISYLLIREKKNNREGSISLLKFYKRRIARIWPLYYFLVLFTFFVLRQLSFFQELPVHTAFADNTHAAARLPGYIFFLPNYTEYRFGSQLYLGQTWTLGVEEFFYLFFPIGLYFTPTRHVPKFLVALVLIFMGASLAIHSGILNPYLPGTSRSILSVFLDKYRIYSFALGGLAAWYLLEGNAKYPPLMKLLATRIASWILITFVFSLVITGTTFSLFTQQFYAVLFALFLFSINASGIRFRLLNVPFIVYFGKISYGIYMLHSIAIVVVLRLIGPIEDFPVYLNVMWMLAATLLTILLSIISYELFEKFFLKHRNGNRN